MRAESIAGPGLERRGRRAEGTGFAFRPSVFRILGGVFLATVTVDAAVYFGRGHSW